MGHESKWRAGSGAWTTHIVTLAPVLVFFLVSGACGLLYQVVWTRQLVLLFGTTAHAVSAVLSTFFLGLALGSILGGHLADRFRYPLRLYGVMELLIAGCALLFLVLAGWGESAVIAVLRVCPAWRGVGIALRSVMALVLLLAPVTLMGATLPLLARYTTSDTRTRGLRIGALYTVNTVGAVLGCMLTGFVLIAALGYARTTVAGACANGAVGVLALALSRWRETPQPAAPPRGSEPAIDDAAPATAARVDPYVLAAFALSGFSALALEVIWTRLLVMVFNGTTYAFTTMLAAILCGIAAGSAVASVVVDRSRRPISLFGGVEVLIGLSCLLTLGLFATLPERLQAENAFFDWAKLVRAKFFLSFSILFLPTFLFGTTFPIVVRAATSSRLRIGRDVGRLYSANTFGGVLGALAGGYVLLPMLGTQASITVLGILLVLIGVLLLLRCPTTRAPAKTAALATVAVLLGLALRRVPEDVSRVVNAWYLMDGEVMIYHREGVEGTVVVSEPRATGRSPAGSDRQIWINGMQATSSYERGVKMNRFQGILPLLFVEEPRTALFMCFGSGVTAGALGLYDFERIDAVEISPDVLEAAPFFAAENFDVLHNEKFNFIVDDGRNFLLLTDRRYDVITFEPMPLVLAGVSTFYTAEYYRLCLEHLTPEGIVSQWFPLHSLEPRLMRSLVRTFTAVFPEYSAWFINADLFLVGGKRRQAIPYERAVARLTSPAIAGALRKVGFDDAVEFLSCFFMGKDAIDRFCAGGAIMTDDRPWAEFEAPKARYVRHTAANLEVLKSFHENVSTIMAFRDSAGARTELDRRYRSNRETLDGLAIYHRGDMGTTAEEAFKRALSIDPKNGNARYYLLHLTLGKAKRFVRWEEPEKAIPVLQDALTYLPDEAELYRCLGEALILQEQRDEAQRAFDRCAELAACENK